MRRNRTFQLFKNSNSAHHESILRVLYSIDIKRDTNVIEARQQTAFPSSTLSYAYVSSDTHVSQVCAFISVSLRLPPHSRCPHPSSPPKNCGTCNKNRNWALSSATLRRLWMGRCHMHSEDCQSIVQTNLCTQRVRQSCWTRLYMFRSFLCWKLQYDSC